MGEWKMTDAMINDGLGAFNNYHMGITAENIADKYACPATSRMPLRLCRSKRQRPR